MTDKVDVLIIGGGPAGLAAAIVLARHELRTLVCEQRPFPVDKPCGEGIMPTGVAYLRHLDVARHLLAGSFFPFAGIRYHSHQGTTAAATFAEGPGWGVRRLTLSTALYKRAQECARLQILTETCAYPLERTAEHIVVQVGKRTVRTRLLIGADGLNSRVRRWAGLNGKRPPPRRWGIRQHFHVPPWSSYVEVYWGKGLEAYVTPCGPEQVGVAFLWDRIRYNHIQGGSNLFASLLQAFPSLQTRLVGVPTMSTQSAVGPLHQVTTSPVGEGILLIGDAAGYLDAVTGEGISLALAQAVALENTVVPALVDRSHQGLTTARELASYAQVYQAIVRPYYRLTSLALWLSRHPGLRERAIQMLQRHPAFFQHLLSANMGLVAPWSPGVIARLLAKTVL